MIIKVGGGGGIVDVGLFFHKFKRFVDSSTIWTSLRKERTGTTCHLVPLHLFDLWLLVWWWWGVCWGGRERDRRVGCWRLAVSRSDGWRLISPVNQYPGTVPATARAGPDCTDFTVLFSPCLRRHGNPPRVYTVVANKNTPSPSPHAFCTSATFELLYLATFSLRFTVFGVGILSKDMSFIQKT